MTTTIASMPDSNLCHEARELAREHLPAELVAHSERTFLLGMTLVAGRQPPPDPELALIASLLHDVTLGESARSTTTRFEVAGADLAREWLRGAGVGSDGATVVWDAIALHTSPGIPVAKSAECAVVHLGAAADVFGVGLHELGDGVLAEVLARHPRTGFEQAVRTALMDTIRACPHAYAFTWLGDTARTHLHLPMPDPLDVLAAAPWPADQR